MVKALYSLMAGLVGALAVHLLIVFQVPSFAGGQVHGVIESLDGGDQAVILDQQGLASAGIKGADPLFRLAACAFDLRNGPVAVRAPQAPQFWTMAIFNSRDEAVFSLTQRLALDGVLDLVVFPERDRGRLEASGTLDSLGNAIAVFSADDVGHAIVRLFAPDQSWIALVNDQARQVTCAPADIDY